MSLALLAVVFMGVLVVGYWLYGGFVARQFMIDDERITPAERVNDGEDYVPTRPFYLFGQHFAAIAAAGPIAGPIIACQAFGWLPCLLWIGVGVVFIGAVHDFSSLAASVRHGGLSVAELMRQQLGGRAGRAVMAFIWIALVYVIVAFTDITAGTFVAGSEELRGTEVDFNPGGAVAAASTLYLGLSVVMGLWERFVRPPLWLTTIIFVPLAFASAWAGTLLSTVFVLDFRTWGLLILAYCVVASLVPVQYLLQPRGYLGGFILFTALGLGVLGILFGGYTIEQAAFKSWDVGGLTGGLFPFLFVTIACGACSGFHGLVCSGTTSKQVARESHMQPVGYGAMLAEAFVALIALVTVMIVAQEGLTGLAPGTIYGNGIGRFMTLLVGEEHLRFAVTFGAMAFSTFVFDTLDVATRLGRYLVQELAGLAGRASALVGSLMVVAIPAYLVIASGPGLWSNFWTLFGASNQLLAALTLLAVTLWLAETGRRIAFTLVPMLFVLTITLWALGSLVYGYLRASEGFDVALVNAVISVVLILLAVYLCVMALARTRRATPTAAPAEGT